MPDLEIDMNETPPPAQPGATISPKPVDIPPRPGSSKSKKILLVLVALIILLGAAIAIWYFTVGKKKPVKSAEDTAPTQSMNESPKKQQKLVVYQDPKLYSIDESGKKEEIAKLDANSKPLRYIAGEDGKFELFYVTQKKVDGGYQVVELKKTDGTKDDSIYTPKSGTEVLYPTVSRDGKTFAYAVVLSNNAANYDAYVLDIASKSEVKVKDDDKLYRPFDFSADNKLLAQQLSCYFCDGPPLAKFAVINTSDGSLEKSYDAEIADSQAPSYGSIIAAADGQSVVVLADKTIGMGMTKADSDKAAFQVASVNLKTGAKEVIYTKSGVETGPALLGFNNMKGQLYLNVSKNVGEGENYSNEFQRITELDGKAKSDISLEFQTLKSGGFLSQVYSIDGKTIFIVLNTKRDGSGAFKSSLVSLPHTEEDATTTNIFEPSAASIEILGTFDF